MFLQNIVSYGRGKIGIGYKVYIIWHKKVIKLITLYPILLYLITNITKYGAKMEQNNMNELLFMQLVMQNQQIAMMSMGKLKHPVSDKIERNLELAKISIDTLDMLKVKTKGNLSSYEEKFLDEVLRELKLNYVDEVNKDQKDKPQAQEGKEEKKKEEKN